MASAEVKKIYVALAFASTSILIPLSINQPNKNGETAVQKTINAAPRDLMDPRCLLPYISAQNGADTVD